MSYSLISTCTGLIAFILLALGIRLSHFRWQRFMQGKWEKASHVFDASYLTKSSRGKLGVALMVCACLLFAFAIIAMFI